MASWTEYASRGETRREHALALQAALGLKSFTVPEYRALRGWLTDLALRANKHMALAEQLIERLRSIGVVVPPVQVLDRLCGEALARGVRILYRALTEPLDDSARAQLDALLTPVPDSRKIVLTWLRQPPAKRRWHPYCGI